MRSGTRTRVLALALVAALPLSGCGWIRGPRSRHDDAGADSSFAARTFQRGRSPAEISAAAGGILYRRYCAICHGETGEGDGFNAYNVQATFGVTPTAFADSAAWSSVSEDTALAVMREGGPARGRSAAMPPWGNTLTPGEVIDVWQYVRSLARARRGP